MINFEFSLFSKKFSKETLLDNYSIHYLNDWLSHESEIKYLFYFGDNSDIENKNKLLNETINLLKNTNLLNTDEKQYIFSLYIDDAYVYEKDKIATLRLNLKSEYQKQEVNDKIIKFLCNHIYNLNEIGFFKHGIIQPLDEYEKKQLDWVDEIEWTYKIIENNVYDIERFDFLKLSDFTYLYYKNSMVKKLNVPIYVSNFNLECYNISKSIEQLDNDIERYKKSIRFLEKKKQEIKKNRRELYKNYKIAYINMLCNTSKLWKEKEI